MKLLSIDIGIKNLAHCLIDTSIPKIMDWNVNNLAPTYKCCSVATHQLDGYLCKKCIQQKSLVELICLCKKQDVSFGTKKEMIQGLKKIWKPIEPSMADLGKRIMQVYEPIQADIVLIENQIGPLASKMKGIQGMVLQYWLMRGAEVYCISAVNKLKLFHHEPTTYSERKKLSVHYTKEVLKKQGWDECHFLKHKKKDDLADTLLQAIWYLHKESHIHFKY
jgi:hypothetical protein